MEERRRSTRTEMQAELVLKRLDEEDGKRVQIHILDVSRNGIGFECTEQLKMGSIYDCNLTLWTKEVIETFVEIVRGKKEGDVFSYGGAFIGMNELDASRIATYQMEEEFKY